LQTPTETSDGLGGVSTAWGTFNTVYASIWPLKGAEYIAAMQTTSEISHKIRIRYLANVTPKLRIKFGTRYFDIQSVINPDERNIYLEMMCRETTPVRDG
jgi:SPP1 family predicted phage head-tail adaptor